MLKVKLSREEALACIIALQKGRDYGWRNNALRKLDKVMGFKVAPEH